MKDLITKDNLEKIISFIKECLFFSYNAQDANIIIENIERKELLRFPASKFLTEAEALLKAINEMSGCARSSTKEQIQAFMDKIHCISTSPCPPDKADIHIILHDQRSKMNSNVGFTIKSQLSADSTLLNSVGDSTNFVYSLGKIKSSVVREFNSLDRFKKKFELLESNSIIPKWVGVGAKTFYNNLMMIDTCLPWIIGECLLYYYSGQAHTIVETESLLRKYNPLNFDIESQPLFYEYKLKQFLLAFALGMTAAKPWNGKFIASGGYIVIKEDGEIVCYHFFERNELEDYLFNNTYFDTPSTKRHKFGTIYNTGPEDLLKLNLQVRFIS